MADEQFERWDPWWWYRDVTSTIIASVTDDWEGFRLILKAEKCPETRVSVPTGCLVMYRVYDESGLVGRKIQGLQPGHCFYEAKVSPLLAECSAMHSGMRGQHLRHFAIYSGDRCVDLICTAEPRFVLLREFANGRNESERPS